jgi:hypothetical protein
LPRRRILFCKESDVWAVTLADEIVGPVGEMLVEAFTEGRPTDALTSVNARFRFQSRNDCDRIKNPVAWSRSTSPITRPAAQAARK